MACHTLHLLERKTRLKLRLLKIYKRFSFYRFFIVFFDRQGLSLNNRAKYGKSAIISKILDFNAVFAFLLGFDYVAIFFTRKLESNLNAFCLFLS